VDEGTSGLAMTTWDWTDNRGTRSTMGDVTVADGKAVATGLCWDPPDAQAERSLGIKARG